MENVSNMSLIEVAVKVLEERHAPININDLIDEVLELKGVSDDESKTDLYVDITTSSTFVYLGEGVWDLKINQSLDEFDKDGSAFTSKDEEYVEEVDHEDYEEDEDEDEDEDSDYEEDEDDEDEESDEHESEIEYEDEEDESEYSEEDDFEEEDDYDEEKYNKIMDDYEDMYGDN